MQPIYDHAIPRYVSGRALLIGDAATITRPHTASGATKALQDALTLERTCREHGSLDEALTAYDHERCVAGNELVELGRRLGRAQVEKTPDWASMTADDFEAWIRATLAGQRLYHYGNVPSPFACSRSVRAARSCQDLHRGSSPMSAVLKYPLDLLLGDAPLAVQPNGAHVAVADPTPHRLRADGQDSSDLPVVK